MMWSESLVTRITIIICLSVLFIGLIAALFRLAYIGGYDDYQYSDALSYVTASIASSFLILLIGFPLHKAERFLYSSHPRAHYTMSVILALLIVLAVIMLADYIISW